MQIQTANGAITVDNALEEIQLVLDVTSTILMIVPAMDFVDGVQHHILV